MRLTARDLTPCQNVNGLWIKRDDLYAPFGDGNVNGGKLRQCMMLVDSVKGSTNGIISCCSIHSPQAPITAATAEYYGLRSVIFYGGTSEERLQELEMPRLTMQHGADVKIAARTGRHNVLYAKAREHAKKEGLFVVEYGFNITEQPEIMFGAVSAQVQNIPDELENLIVTCGSGITTIGIIKGIEAYGKHVKNVHVVSTAPDRSAMIYKHTGREVIVHDLFHSRGFAYEKGVELTYEGINLHPNYEAKAFEWLQNESGINLHDSKSLFWIVGAKPYKAIL